jgi:hypothetical protein
MNSISLTKCPTSFVTTGPTHGQGAKSDGVPLGGEHRAFVKTVVSLEQIIREAASVIHGQMKKNQETYAAIENPEQTSLGFGIAAIEVQDMAAKRYAYLSFSRFHQTDRLPRVVVKDKQL